MTVNAMGSLLTHCGRDKTVVILQMKFYIHFLESKLLYFDLKLIEVFFPERSNRNQKCSLSLVVNSRSTDLVSMVLQMSL